MADYGVPFAVVEDEGDTVVVLLTTSDRSALDADPDVEAVGRRRGPAFVPETSRPATKVRYVIGEQDREAFEAVYATNPLGPPTAIAWRPDGCYFKIGGGHVDMAFDGDTLIYEQMVVPSGQGYVAWLLDVPIIEWYVRAGFRRIGIRLAIGNQPEEALVSAGFVRVDPTLLTSAVADQLRRARASK